MQGEQKHTGLSHSGTHIRIHIYAPGTSVDALLIRVRLPAPYNPAQTAPHMLGETNPV